MNPHGWGETLSSRRPSDRCWGSRFGGFGVPPEGGTPNEGPTGRSALIGLLIAPNLRAHRTHPYPSQEGTDVYRSGPLKLPSQEGTDVYGSGPLNKLPSWEGLGVGWFMRRNQAQAGVHWLRYVLVFAFACLLEICCSQLPASAPDAPLQPGVAPQKRDLDFPYPLPPPIHHVDVGLADATARHASSQRHLELLREKLADRWFAALIETAPEHKDRIATRLPSWKSLVEFIEQRAALVEVWALPPC